MSHTDFIFSACLSDDYPIVIKLPTTLEEMDDWQKGRLSAGEAMPRMSSKELDLIMGRLSPLDFNAER
jgi:hypothetical protein